MKVETVVSKNRFYLQTGMSFKIKEASKKRLKIHRKHEFELNVYL